MTTWELAAPETPLSSSVAHDEQRKSSYARNATQAFGRCRSGILPLCERSQSVALGHWVERRLGATTNYRGCGFGAARWGHETVEVGWVAICESGWKPLLRGANFPVQAVQSVAIHWQAARIIMDILLDALELIWSANDVIERFFLP